MRVLALYLPQFHRFDENDQWWGEGYTEWTAVKSAKPLYKGHIQPRVPMGGDYYDLSDQEAAALSKQAELAREYGIYGFVFYHYYFKGQKLMELPAEILLRHKEIDLKYCLDWANETWTRAWYGRMEDVLIRQEYGDKKDWKEHFDYLIQFFKDERYIKIDNKPVLCIYRTFDIEHLDKMRAYFEERAREEGFDGIYLIGGRVAERLDDRDLCDAWYYFEPGYSLKRSLTPFGTFCYNASTAIRGAVNTVFKTQILERRIPIRRIYDSILSREYGKNEYPGLIARWDNTPRRGYKGLVYTGGSPELFGDALCKLSRKIDKDSFLFINAWNEWGEGAMLEADEAEGYAYLQKVKEANDGQ